MRGPRVLDDEHINYIYDDGSLRLPWKSDIPQAREMAEHRALIAPDKQAPLVVKSVPTYRPGPGELLFKVEAAGLAIADYAVHLTGLLVEKWPVILGQDAAGIVEEVGEGVTKFRKGDRV